MKSSKLFTAVLVISTMLFSTTAGATTLSISNSTVTKGSVIEVPVYLAPTSEDSADTVNGYSVSITYDSSVLTPVSQGTDALSEDLYALNSLESGAFVAGLLNTDDTDTTNDQVSVGWANATAVELSAKTELFKVKFVVSQDTTLSSTELAINVKAYANAADTLVDSDQITLESASLTLSNLLKGDANADGIITIADATIISKFLIGGDTQLGGDADYNGDGEVTIADATAITKVLIGEN